MQEHELNVVRDAPCLYSNDAQSTEREVTARLSSQGQTWMLNM